MPRRVRAAWAVVAATCSIACGSTTTAPGSVALPPMGPAVSYMLDGLTTYITQALAENQSNLPRNPQSASFIQAKITMLQAPGLAGEIRNNGRWSSVQVLSSNGRPISIGCIFPLEAMRADAGAAVATVQSAVSVIEVFLEMPLPVTLMRVWYGFVVGNSGGGGSVYTEDRGTYEARTPPTRLPHDAILGHEVAHSFISNESLTQFLELYAYNVRQGSGTDPARWTFTRNWTPGLETNQDAAALLDIYQLIGPDAMKLGYRAIVPLRPQYGEPLAPAVIDAFVAQVPGPLQSQVSAKLGRITF